MPRTMKLPIRLLVVAAVYFDKINALQFTFILWDEPNVVGNGLIWNFHVYDFCHNNDDHWKKSVSTLDPCGNCYVLHAEPDCKGEKRFIYPGSPGHKDLREINFDKKTQSINLCDLNDAVGEHVEPDGTPWSSFEFKRPEEYDFWSVALEALSANYEKAFTERAREKKFISWDFLPDVGGSPGRQYRHVLDWILDRIRDGTFNQSVMKSLRRLANQVVEVRHERNLIYLESEAGTEPVAVHTHIEGFWKQIVTNLEEKIDKN